MIGASKLQEEDIVEIKRLLATGISQAELARTFVPISGQKISRIHINKINAGKRWNPEIRSFSMKEQEETTENLEDVFALSPWSKYATN
jgi:hypothetical protein